MSDTESPKSSSFAGATVTAKITRTNSLFPASKTYQTPYGPLRSGQQVVTPVRDPRSGQIIGYRNTAGQAVNKDGVRLTTEAQRKADAEAERKRQEARAKGISGYQQELQRSRAALEGRSGYTVDGNEIKPFGWTISADGTTVNADGTVTDENGRDITHTQRGQVAAQRSAASSVFGALNLNDITGDEQFLMSFGDAIDPATGDPIRKPVDDMDSLGDRARRQQQRGNTAPARNEMSIAQGVRWLMRLSSKDPAAYNQMVIRLRNAQYINGRDEDLPLNGWSGVVGEAFAAAAADLAQAASVGETRTLPQWLEDRGKTFADSLAEEEAANAYQPVERHYTDPEALAATARATAEELLGRGLTDEEAARFASRFRGLESANYDAIDAAGRAKGSATVTDPSAGGQAEAFIRSPEFNADRGKQLVGSYMDAFKSLLGI